MLQWLRDADDAGSSGASGTYDPTEMRWVSGFVAMVGLWIAVSPTVYDVSPLLAWNNGIVGAGIAVVAGASFVRPQTLAIRAVAGASLAALLGIWTLLAPLLVGADSASLLWSNVGAGSLVAIVSGYHARLLDEVRRGDARARS